MELTTRRFLLRDFVDDDAPAFEMYHRDPRFLEFYGEDEAGPEHARELMQHFKVWATEQPRLNYQLAVIQRAAPRALVGCCGLRCAGAEPGEAELGIELAPEYWGRYGYAIEIVRAMIEFGFGSLRLQAIHGDTVSANSRAVRLARSFGAVAVTRPGRDGMPARGGGKIQWQVTREQWEGGEM